MRVAPGACRTADAEENGADAAGAGAAAAAGAGDGPSAHHGGWPSAARPASNFTPT